MTPTSFGTLPFQPSESNDSFSHWQKTQASLLKAELESLIASVPDVAGFRSLLREPLTKKARGLAAGDVQASQWPLLPMAVCDAVSAHADKAVPVAAAIQLFTAAGDVFDDVEDADSVDSLSCKYGPGVATNVATALLVVAQRAIARLAARGVEHGTILRVVDTVNSYYATACAGQHLDLSPMQDSTDLEEAHLEIVSMKSAAQIECACRAGAMVGTENAEIIDALARFGHCLGMACQIANDILGITRGDDIQRRKLTLPIVYALAQTDDEAQSQLNAAFCRPTVSIPDSGSVKNLLFASGALHYATLKVETFKQHALDFLLGVEKAGFNIERLSRFLG